MLKILKKVKKGKMNKILVFIICLVVVFSTAFIGSLFTMGNTNSAWYQNNRPAITPPNFVFPIVWNILFFLIALSLYFAWISGKKSRKIVALLFGVNLALNMLWSYLFFSLQLPFYAFIEFILLWLSILAIFILGFKIDKKVSWLILPYLLWVSFAGILNWLFAFWWLFSSIIKFKSQSSCKI